MPYINRLVTTKQKKFLERTFKCLGIDIDELLEVNNIRHLKEENERLHERVAFLEKALTTTNETLALVTTQVTEFIDEMHQEMMRGDS